VTAQAMCPKAAVHVTIKWDLCVWSSVGTCHAHEAAQKTRTWSLCPASPLQAPHRSGAHHTHA